MRQLTILSFCIGLVGLSACGFTPVYAPQTANGSSMAQTHLRQIAVANIADRSGQILRNALLDRLQAQGRLASSDGLAVLTLQVDQPTESRVGLGIAKDASISRAQIRLQTIMRLIDVNGVEVMKRPLLAVSSYNTLGSQFKTQVTEDDVREQALHALADQITAQLELFQSANPQ